MTRDAGEAVPSAHHIENALASLTAEIPDDFTLRVLRHVGIPPERYDVWASHDTAAGELYVAYSPAAVTGAALEQAVGDATAFEELHRRRTHRTAVPSGESFSPVRSALRTGAYRNLPVDLTGLTPLEQAVLHAVQTIPQGQLRQASWVAKEAGATSTGEVRAALASNPVAVLIPGHRVTDDDGTPLDVDLPLGAGHALRSHEGIDMRRLGELAERGVFFLGSDTTRIYCHPTCPDARRITPRHQKPFGTALDARAAGYRACRSCKPVTA